MTECNRVLLALEEEIAANASWHTADFHFCLSKGYHRSPTGMKPYETNDFDLVALVALSENVLKFTADRRGAQRIAISEIETLRAAPCASLEQAIDDLGFARLTVPGFSFSPTFVDGGRK